MGFNRGVTDDVRHGVGFELGVISHVWSASWQRQAGFEQPVGLFDPRPVFSHSKAIVPADENEFRICRGRERIDQQSIVIRAR